jgi:3-phenylpropionate/trans-cinnamate dioxygenase ferredoxin reductase component
MEYVGYADPGDDVTIRGGRERLEGGEFVVFWHRDGRVTAAMNVNIWDVNEDLRKIVGTEVPADRLADESIPLTDLAT